MNVERLQKLAASVRTGGKGSVRRQAAGTVQVSAGVSQGHAASQRHLCPTTFPPCGLTSAALPNNPPCRKKKAVHKTGTDDKRVQATLKRLGLNPIPGERAGRGRAPGWAAG